MEDTLKTKLAGFFNYRDFSVSPMNGGASVRNYYILQFARRFYFPRKKVILMQIPADRLDMADDYLTISYYLRRRRIPTPRVYEMNREQGWIFLEPARGARLDQYLRDCSLDERRLIYHQLIDFLLELQRRAVYEEHCPAFRRSFDIQKYRYEFNFHVREQLLQNYYGHSLSPDEEPVFNTFVQEISHVLDIPTPLFVHRDFQTSNIFYYEKERKIPFQLIDIQDARSGNPVYDLVSLLWDSYVTVPDQLREQLLHRFYIGHPTMREKYDPEQFQKIINYTLIQRKLHDAGAFVYTEHATRNRFFFRFIHPAVEWSLEAMRHYPTLLPARNLLEHIVSVAHTRKVS